jgi:hypothetical protein
LRKQAQAIFRRYAGTKLWGVKNGL